MREARRGKIKKKTFKITAAVQLTQGFIDAMTAGGRFMQAVDQDKETCNTESISFLRGSACQPFTSLNP